MYVAINLDFSGRLYVCIVHVPTASNGYMYIPKFSVYIHIAKGFPVDLPLALSGPATHMVTRGAQRRVFCLIGS